MKIEDKLTGINNTKKNKISQTKDEDDIHYNAASKKHMYGKSQANTQISVRKSQGIKTALFCEQGGNCVRLSRYQNLRLEFEEGRGVAARL
jgi:hypothetical protein